MLHAVQLEPDTRHVIAMKRTVILYNIRDTLSSSIYVMMCNTHFGISHYIRPFDRK